MKVKDREEWLRFRARNPGKYERNIINCAERWATLMEEWLGRGKQLAEIAEKTMDETGPGLPRRYLAQAVCALVRHWVHGAELKSWYDKRRRDAKKEGVEKEGVCA